MKPLPKDAKGFVDGIVSYIKSDGKSTAAGTKVHTMLSRVSQLDQKTNMAVVESPVKLTGEEMRDLERIVVRIIGRDVRFDYKTLPSLVGGLRVKVGDWVLDTSLVTQLESLREQLTG